MTTAEKTEPLRYRGSSSFYVDIATRGTNEFLGFAIQYAVHPSNIGCFIVRFVAHGPGVEGAIYKHLSYREPAKFLIPGEQAEVIEGVRLNKVAFKVFEPGIKSRELDQFATKFGLWSMLTEWVAEQATEEGFIITVDLEKEIRSLLLPVPTPENSVQCVVEFPNLSAPEHKAPALKLVQTPEPDEDDEDEGKANGPKEWIN